jgi:isoquinoline 1-oxidoreductase beta subunit
MPAIPNLLARPTRRGFLAAAAGGGAGLVLGFSPVLGRIASAAEAAPNPFAAYVVIAPDSTVTVLSSQMDMGQGVYTGLATLVAEELDADWGQMRVEGAAGNPALYGNPASGGKWQLTGGSNSIAGSWDRYRQAGAAARAMLTEAAAAAWRVPAAEITVTRGVLQHPSGKAARFGELAQAAAKLAPPAALRLKDSGNWALIGNPNLRRLDSAAKTTGRQDYTIDVRLPGMLTAMVAHPPAFGGKVRSFGATAARAVPGVVDVVEIPQGVAVVAKDTWAAMKGREALTVDWDLDHAERRGSAALTAQYQDLAQGSVGAAIARNDGDADRALAGAARVIEASYEFPYLAHAALEPLNAVARMQDGVLEVWGGHQAPDVYQAAAARVAGIDPGKVRLHVMMTGGGFGRRATLDSDIVSEVVSIGQATGWKSPVRVQWTREDDMTGGRYRPMYRHTVRVGLDEGGNLVGWRHRIVGQSILKGTMFEGWVKNGVDATSVEGVADTLYAIANLKLDLVTPDVKVPVLWWRSVGSTHTAYVMETMIDEAAHAAGVDPLAFRRRMLAGQPRHLAVLELAAEMAGWSEPLPAGRARGIAVHKSFGTSVAQVAEILVDGHGLPKVERVVCAVDCGVAVNPDVIRAQIEGGIGFGLGAVLHSAINLDAGGRVVETNFDGYGVLRFDEMPRVEVHIVPSTERPTGVGEPGVPPIGPALANAYFAATGRRVRTLPFAKALEA